MPGRSYSAGTSYRYGFNGKEKSDELGNSNYDFGERIYDGRIGRWLSIDKYANLYPDQSHYSFSLNNPNVFTDNDGNWITDINGNPIYTKNGYIMEMSKDGKYWYKAEQRTYYTNDGKKVYAIKYLAAFKVVDCKEVGGLVTVKPGAASEPIPYAYTYDCHGNTCFKGNNIYIPGNNENGGDNVSAIFHNRNEYGRVKEKDVMEGDVAVFVDANGISHSATRNADGTYTSKDDRAVIRTDATIADMESLWGKLEGFYRYEGDENGNITSTKGEVSEANAQKAIENVKQRKKMEKEAVKKTKTEIKEKKKN